MTVHITRLLGKLTKFFSISKSMPTGISRYCYPSSLHLHIKKFNQLIISWEWALWRGFLVKFASASDFMWMFWLKIPTRIIMQLCSIMKLEFKIMSFVITSNLDWVLGNGVDSFLDFCFSSPFGALWWNLYTPYAFRCTIFLISMFI